MDQEQTNGPRPDYQDLVEAKDNIEALKADFVQLCHSLQSLVAELLQQGPQGQQLAKGLFLEETLVNLQRPENERGLNDDFSVVDRYEYPAPNFVSRFLYGYTGVIHSLGKAYLRVKTFYGGDSRFNNFLNSFEHFIESVNKNNTECRIPPLPELLTPIDESTQVLNQGSVESTYKSLPKIRQAVGVKLAEYSKAEGETKYLIIDLANMPLNQSGSNLYKARVKIAAPAEWED